VSLLRNNAIVAAGTAASRATGLWRVSVLGIVLGQSSLTDAYNVANATPNIVYELLLGGVLSASLVPLFTRLHEDSDREGTKAVVAATTLALGVLTAFAVVAAPLIFRAYSVLADDADFNVADYRSVGTALSRIFLVQIFFYGLNAVGSALLQARRRFFAAAWSPVLANLVIIAALYLVPRTTDGRTPLLSDALTNGGLRWTLGLGATIGIATMALALLPAIAHAGAPLSLRVDLKNPAIASLRKVSGWAFGYVAANQVSILVIQNLLISVGEGAQDAYTKAFTWFVLPHGLLAVTLATTFSPEMTSAIRQRNRPLLLQQASLGIRLTALFTIPAGFGLFTLRRPIIGAAFEHGAFDSGAAANTSRALAGFALGLGCFSVYLFVLRVFYAHQDSRTPFVINVGENLLNIVLGVLLVGRFGVLGLGAAFALAYALSAIWALSVLHSKLPSFPWRPVVGSLWRIVLASVVMAEVVWWVARQVGGNSGGASFVRVAIGTMVGGAVFVGMLTLLRSPEIDELRTRLRRLGPAPSGDEAG
jgi:putative peptidoglycan lipid II flippase